MGRIVRGMLAALGLTVVVAMTGWIVRAEAPAARGEAGDLRSSSLIPAAGVPGPLAPPESAPVVYERGLAPLFPAWPATSRRPAFT